MVSLRTEVACTCLSSHRPPVLCSWSRSSRSCSNRPQEFLKCQTKFLNGRTLFLAPTALRLGKVEGAVDHGVVSHVVVVDAVTLVNRDLSVGTTGLLYLSDGAGAAGVVEGEGVAVL